MFNVNGQTSKVNIRRKSRMTIQKGGDSTKSPLFSDSIEGENSERGYDTIAINLMNGFGTNEAQKWLPRIEKTGENKALKTEGSFAAISAAGRSNACLLGFKTSDAWLFATNTMIKTFSDLCGSVVQLYCFVYFEMGSNHSSHRDRTIKRGRSTRFKMPAATLP